MPATQLTRQRSLSSSSKPVYSSQSKGKGAVVPQPFEPCAATASLFLYSQGSSILCLHHDTLAIERRFDRHVDNIQLICVDNVSERGAGRLVVSYDVGKTAIVWDLFSGQEIARFASFEHITVAAWMRNGNVAFGNSKGEVILFEPATSEHVSARTIYDPITALAPSADCKAYAVGYNNGSILLATLQPTFTILHTLTTQRAPSPIAGLAWHASSSKQKSDMLATQTSDGDLRVWSVSKPPTGDAPRVIRALKRSDHFFPGHNWISWSKNGRIIQYSDRQTWSWDVRTKHVTYDSIPTVEEVRGLSGYGPTASLFTLGPNHTVQQYDLEVPQMVANVQHLPVAIPPTPPEEFNRQLGLSASESEEEAASPIISANRQVTALEAARLDRAQTASPRSTRSQTETLSSRTSSTQGRYEKTSSAQRHHAGSTVFSLGSQSQMSRDPLPTNTSMSYASSIQSPVSTKSGRKGSRLKQEVLPSPVDRAVTELFPYTRSRLSDIPYKPPRAFDEQNLTPDDLRRQMLSVVFGWEADIQDLIRDELSRQPIGSQSAVLLSKWLDDDPDQMASMMGAGGTASSLDWMMLALGGIGNQAQSKKIGQAFVEKMLAKGDIHAAATILLSLGDYDDAIEVYVTRNHFMEAILLTCLLMPQNWQRQSFLVREWGKHVVENSQQHLAIRCFSCTGVEPSEPWTSPTAQMAAKATEQAYAGQASDTPQNSGLRRDFLEAPTPVAMGAPQAHLNSSVPGRMTPKNQALKLITSFGPQSQGQYRFPGLKSDDRTPTNAPGITPIAESAIGESAMTPGGLGSYRLNNLRSINSALSARTATPGGAFSRRRLPSIGETPIDVNPPAFPAFTAPKALPTPVDSGSDKEKELTLAQNQGQSIPRLTTDLPLLLTSAKYEPGHQTPIRETPLTAVAPDTIIKMQRPPSPPQGLFDVLKGDPQNHNGSRGRKPDGLSIQWPPVASTMTDAETNQMATLAAGLQRTDTAVTYMDTHSEMTSPPTTGHSYQTLKSPSISGRSIDQYISSLEEAQYYTKHHRSHRTGSRDRSHTKDGERKRSRHRLRAPSEEDRERGRVIPAAKRSPSSPVPMSPDHLNLYNASVESFDSALQSRSEAGSTKTGRHRGKSTSGKLRSGSKTAERHRHRSTSRHHESHKSRPSSRAVSRRHSPDAAYESRGRTRSKSKHEESGLRSPSSPLPMSPSGSDRPKYAEAEQALRFVESDRQRLSAQQRSTSRSLSRKGERGTSSRRDASPDRRKTLRARSHSRQPHHEREPGMARKSSLAHRNETSTYTRQQEPFTDERNREEMTASPLSVHRTAQLSEPDWEAKAGSNPQFAAHRRRKELAAAELEARRLSLARRPSAPPIPFPGQNTSPNHTKSRSMSGAPPLMRSQTDDSIALPSHSYAGKSHAKHSPNNASFSDAQSPLKSNLNSRMGLPATPRAMRHPILSPQSGEDSVPELPKNNMLLANDFYQPELAHDIRRSMSAPVPDYGFPVPADLPSHPAFDRRIPGSRSSSKTRDDPFSPPGVRNRDTPREQKRMSPRESLPSNRIITTNVDFPPALPELQHLASPPPPPPMPTLPHHSPIVHDGDIVTVGWPEPSAAAEPAPTTAPPIQTSFPENTQSRHRRGRSINENFAGKIRSITTRLRSTSRGRNTKSPQTEEETPSPYESLPMHVDFVMGAGREIPTS